MMSLLTLLAVTRSRDWSPTWPLVICLIGLVLWVFLPGTARLTKVSEAGRIMFFCGLLVVLFGLAGVAVF